MDNDITKNIITMLTSLQNGQLRMEKSIQGLETRQNKLREIIETVDLKVEAFNSKFDKSHAELKKDIRTVRDELIREMHYIKAELSKKVKSHERRINTIEDELDIPHPNKN